MSHVTAILSLLHEPSDRCCATRLFRGEPVLRWTLDRLARSRQGTPLDERRHGEQEGAQQPSRDGRPGGEAVDPGARRERDRSEQQVGEAERGHRRRERQVPRLAGTQEAPQVKWQVSRKSTCRSPPVCSREDTCPLQ